MPGTSSPWWRPHPVISLFIAPPIFYKYNIITISTSILSFLFSIYSYLIWPILIYWYSIRSISTINSGWPPKKKKIRLGDIILARDLPSGASQTKMLLYIRWGYSKDILVDTLQYWNMVCWKLMDNHTVSPIMFPANETSIGWRGFHGQPCLVTGWCLRFINFGISEKDID